jgi:small-conductance mechanosensitive channel
MSQEIMFSFIIVVGLYIGVKISKGVFNKLSKVKQVSQKRVYYIEKVFEVLFMSVSIILLLFVWSVDIKSVALFASSFFAIIGVALFAQWSILSNITASVIIFFNFPAKIGDTIRIVDGDNGVEGEIHEISLFQMELIDSNGNMIFYPNNLILQKPVMKVQQKR